MAHDTHHHTATGGRDTGAAFVGLVGGGLFLIAVCYATVQWTNSQFAGRQHGGATPAAATSH